MTHIANAYRRGAVYWWRRQIALPVSERPMFALSPRIADQSPSLNSDCQAAVPSRAVRSIAVPPDAR